MSFKKADELKRDLDEERALMCSAPGCPNRWSVDAGKGRYCSAHHWSPASEWDRITAEQLQNLSKSKPPEPEVKKLSKDEKLEILTKLRSIVYNRQTH